MIGALLTGAGPAAGIAGRLLTGRAGFALIGALAVLYFPGQWSPIPLPAGAAYRIGDLAGDLSAERAALSEARTTLASTAAELDAERRARAGANERAAAAEREAARLSRELDETRREADEAQGRVVIETREVIRNADPNWTRLPVPKPVLDSWVRVWCAGDPARADHPLCRNPASDDGRSGAAP